MRPTRGTDLASEFKEDEEERRKRGGVQLVYQGRGHIWHPFRNGWYCTNVLHTLGSIWSLKEERTLMHVMISRSREQGRKEHRGYVSKHRASSSEIVVEESLSSSSYLRSYALDISLCFPLFCQWDPPFLAAWEFSLCSPTYCGSRLESTFTLPKSKCCL